jgi:DNA-binding NarL/FixJ family response regulator
MTEQKPEQIIKLLKSIDDKMDMLISIQKKSMPKQVISKEEQKVLGLCDRKHTVADIAKETNKTENNVNVILSHLRDKVLIRSIEIDGKVVYERI